MTSVKKLQDVILFLSCDANVNRLAVAVAKYCDECVCVSVCLSLCLSVRQHISRTKLLCMLPMSVARSTPGILTISRIAYGREGGDGRAQSGRSVIYECVVTFVYV